MTERSVNYKNMSPRTDTQNEKIREERKQQILAVALEVMAEKGFSKASISAMAQKAGISKGLMYNYFESKEDLVIQILMSGFDELTKSLKSPDNTQLTADEFHHFIDHTFETLEKELHFWRMYFMVLLQPDVYAIIAPHMEELVGPFYQTVSSYFISQGCKDPVTEVRFLAAVLDGVGLHFILDPQNFPLEGVRKKMHQIFKIR